MSKMAEGFFGTTEGTSVLRWLAMEFHVPGGPIAPSGMKKHGPPPWLTNNVRNGVAIVPAELTTTKFQRVTSPSSFFAEF